MEEIKKRPAITEPVLPGEDLAILYYTGPDGTEVGFIDADLNEIRSDTFVKIDDWA
ncbi:hypothetical protein [Halapricum desulfuricans]|uniref:Uncharacterized protein n=1 Tax=Halapricum desulfuricans TaxID=2841257 RepID=A0A897N7K6_9EURY|nr:hypothetical protein [Halapricum desulfuricans]QSG06376.1 hypothetical protein HSR121_2044 [Halapricum desulfuricans]